MMRYEDDNDNGEMTKVLSLKKSTLLRYLAQ